MDIRGADRIYSNQATMEMSLYDITLTFLNTRPGKEITANDVVVEVIMSPQHAKTFAIILENYVRDYERIFGEISLVANQDVIDEINRERQQG